MSSADREPAFSRGADFAMDRRMRVRSIRIRHLATATAVAALAAIAPTATAAGVPGGAATLTCTNPANGASWQIVVDPGSGTVDANPARFSPGEITWFDPKDGGNYTLDRKSGEFVASVASSTGGYFRRGHCNMENAQ